jgi:hypothetical protein
MYGVPEGFPDRGRSDSKNVLKYPPVFGSIAKTACYKTKLRTTFRPCPSFKPASYNISRSTFHQNSILPKYVPVSTGHCSSLAHPIVVATAAVPTHIVPPTIQWTDCSPNQFTQLKCANFFVPLDWSKPKAHKLTLHWTCF